MILSRLESMKLGTHDLVTSRIPVFPPLLNTSHEVHTTKGTFFESWYDRDHSPIFKNKNGQHTKKK